MIFPTETQWRRHENVVREFAWVQNAREVTVEKFLPFLSDLSTYFLLIFLTFLQSAVSEYLSARIYLQNLVEVLHKTRRNADTRGVCVVYSGFLYYTAGFCVFELTRVI